MMRLSRRRWLRLGCQMQNSIFQLMESFNHMEFVNVAVTLWAIWTARRKAIHESIFQSPHATHSFVARFIAELQNLKQFKSVSSAIVGRPISHVGAMSSSSSRRLLGSFGSKSPEGFCKIKVEACLDEQLSKCVVAAICRDGVGRFMAQVLW